MNTKPSLNHPGVGRRKDKLVTDVNGIVDDADDLLKEVASSTSEEFVAARTRIEAKLAETISSLRAARIEVARSTSYVANAAHDYVTGNPWKIIGIAAAGLAVAIIIRRCSYRSGDE